MAVEVTGSPNYYKDSHADSNDHTISVTIPADCTLILFWEVGTYSGLSGMDNLNFTGASDGVDFTSIVTNNDTGDPYNAQAYYLESTIDSVDWPGTGAGKTLYYTLTNHPGEGGAVVVAFCKGNDTNAGSIIVATDSVRGPGDGDFDATLSGVVSGDLSFISACIYSTNDITGRGSGQSTLATGAAENSTDWEISYEDGEGSPNLDSDDNSYFGGVAFAINAAAVADTEVAATTDALVISGKSPNIDLNFGPTTDALVLTEYSTGVGLNVEIDATTDALAVAAYSADIIYDVGVTATTDALAITENSADIIYDVEVTGTVDELALSEQAATVSLGVNIDAGVDALAITEHVASISGVIEISTTTDALTLTANAANIDLNFVASTDALTLTEYSASISAGTNIAASTDALALTEYGATLALDAEVQAALETLAIAEYAASIGTGAAPTYGINLNTGDLIHIFTP